MDEHDERPESLDRYWDPKLETLGELLDQLSDDGAMDLEELDGFFAALHCCPQLVPPSEYLSEIFSDDAALENDEIFSGPDAAKLMFSLLIHHWNAVGEAFRTQDFFIPLLLEDEHGKAHGNNWAMGFMRGVDMREDAWKELFDDENRFSWFFPILTLADETLSDDEEGPRSEALPEKPVITDEDREKLLAAVSGAVTDMYRYFAPHRQRQAALIADLGAPQKPKSKIGRNDPCYCGSGKKYKKCCGTLPVN